MLATLHVIEAITDVEASLLPPHITFRGAVELSESMLKGNRRTVR